MADDDNKIIFDAPSLEAPPSATDGVTGGGMLFNDEALALVTAKLAISEGTLAIITKDIKFNDFMRELLLIAMNVVQSEAGSFLELNPKSNCLFFRTSVGSRSDQITHYEVPMGQGIAGHVAEARQIVVVSNVDDDQRALKSIQKAVGFEPNNLIALPILVRGRLFGVLELMNRFGQETYSTTDIEILKYYSDAAARAIEVRLMIAWNAKKAAQTPSEDIMIREAA